MIKGLRALAIHERKDHFEKGRSRNSGFLQTPAPLIVYFWPRLSQFYSVRLCDTGTGIKAENFSPFVTGFNRIDAGTGRRFERSRPGLAPTNRVVKFQDGRIGREGVPGKGSTTLVLPLISTKEEA